MKHWYSLPPLSPRTYAFYAFVTTGLLTILLKNLKWPNLFPDWSENGIQYSHEVMSGIIAFVLILTVVILYSRQGIDTLTQREKVGSFAFLFGFMMIPVSKCLALASYSNWFSIDPMSISGQVVQLEHLQETLSTVFIAIMFPIIVYMLLLRDKPPVIVQDT